MPDPEPPREVGDTPRAPSRKRIIEWMQEFVDFSLMTVTGTAEIEGSAYAGKQQEIVSAFVGIAERELGITLKTYGDLDHEYWTPEQHNTYHQEQGRLEERGIPLCDDRDHSHWQPHRHAPTIFYASSSEESAVSR